ncbi:MAG: chloride channel protein [Phycisphaeraceae bacterium]|nr:chloride channel protein [Phycisphaeraceae bacterium]
MRSLRERLTDAPRFRSGQDWVLIAIGAFIGVATALGAILFVRALESMEHLSRQAHADWSIWLLPVVPMAGALATGLLVHFFASDARGHGVPQVINAVVKRKGVIPIRVGLVKVIASISTVGTGGSGGAEGPIVQIGATFGSVIGRFLRVVREHQNTFVGCGAAAGIASVFNAPIAGVFFVLEVILRDFSLRTFTPVVVASVFSAATTQAILGADEAIFTASLAVYGFTLAELPSYIFLGLICAAVAAGFTRLLHLGEDAYERLRLHPIIKPVTGAFLLGLLGIAYLAILQGAHAGTRVPAFFGNGYDVIQWTIAPETYTDQTLASQAPTSAIPGAHAGILLLIILVFAKAVGTTFTLASGGSGGVFAPSLFLGATAGGAFGVALERLGLMPVGSSPAAYALIGMGAVVAGTTFAPLTAILLLFELTREPRVLLPIMLAAVIATVASRILMRDSIYTHRLRQSGVLLGWTGDLATLRKTPLARCRQSPLPPEPIYPADPLSKLIALHAVHDIPDFPVVDQASGRYLGLVTGYDMRTALIDREAVPLLLVAELLHTDYPVLHLDEMLDTAMDKFARHDVASLAVVDPARPDIPIGMITRADVLKAYRDALHED